MTFSFGDDPPNGIGSSVGVQDAIDNSALSGVFGGRPFGKYMTGARTIIKINGALAGFAFAVSWRIDTAQKPIWTIDNWVPHEFAPQRVMVSGTMGMFHIPGQGPSSQLIQSDILSFMFHKYITIEVRDSTTNRVIFKTDKAVITSRQEDIQSERIATVQLTWNAIGWQDERTPVLPAGLQPDAVGGNDNGITNVIQGANQLIDQIF